MKPLTRTALVSAAALAAAPALAVSGEDVLQNACAACHVRHEDGRWERIDAVRKTPEGWDITVTRMMRNHGVALEPQERAAVVRYLSDTRGLTPEEAEGRRYILEREPVAFDEGPDTLMTQTCGRCHSYTRVALQRRTPEDWAHLVNFHLGQFPTLEYQALARDRDWLAGQQWPLVILDEAHILKNPASHLAKALREIPAQGRIALTGTPMENSLGDLWTLFDWVVPGLLGDRKRFQALFRTPIEKHGDAGAQARLNRRLRPFLLRRTKEEVAAELPPRTEILERVSLPKAQQGLYEAVRSAMDQRVREAIGSRGLAGARITVLDALLKLRQVCCDPTLVKTGAARSVTDSAKRDRLRELLAELVAEGRRVLVFSQFVEMLRLIEADLSAVGIASLSLTGETRDRAAVLDAFARGDAPVFLLSLKAGGVGLTLTEADTVILFDPWWNPAVERQAMDRAHRIGQTKPVFVHRLVAVGTVEEKILDLQARKQALADALFDENTDSSLPILDEATLQDLFAPLIG